VPIVFVHFDMQNIGFISLHFLYCTCAYWRFLYSFRFFFRVNCVLHGYNQLIQLRVWKS